MASLISLGIKGKDGKYKNFTLSINNEVNQYGQNVSMWVEQSKEERDAKAKKNYVGNGKVVWTDGTNVAPAKQSVPANENTIEEADDDMPF